MALSAKYLLLYFIISITLSEVTINKEYDFRIYDYIIVTGVVKGSGQWHLFTREPTERELIR